MRFPALNTPADAAAALPLALALGLLLAPVPAAAMFDCNHIVADKQRFDLSALGGPHSVVMSHQEGQVWHNTTYTVDICGYLKKKGDVSKTEQCPNGSKVCAIQRLITVGENPTDTFSKAFPLAGNLQDHGGKPLDPELTRLSTSDSHSDSQKEGLRLVMKGGFDKTDSGKKRQQRVIIEFLCDPKRNGTEGEYDPEDKYDRDGDPDGKYERSDDPLSARSSNPLLYRAEGDDGNGEDGGDGGDDGGDDDGASKEIQLGNGVDPSLVYNSYGPMDDNSDMDVLRLTWSSKYACEKRADGDDEGDEQPNPHWGFFTWLVILVFLGTAAYLIFGSWLNYNRYGARGWDLVPHGDTIRDVPYLMKDWARRVLNTVQGSGSRGGYSAV
ncbi:autophagy-related protein 27 [Whalleya microplaca]|nr:autophagy-related protein 27 [Whalleya microplaca]